MKTAFQINTERIDNHLATGFYSSAREAYNHIKGLKNLDKEMKEALLNYIKTEQADETIEAKEEVENSRIRLLRLAR